MTDMNERAIVPMAEEVFPVLVKEVPAEPANTELDGAWRTEAGRKGAYRVHELIEAGKRYEREHGLKSGRQRLRQLIELGKKYEREHGTAPIEHERPAR